VKKGANESRGMSNADPANNQASWGEKKNGPYCIRAGKRLAPSLCILKNTQQRARGRDGRLRITSRGRQCNPTASSGPQIIEHRRVGLDVEGL